ncbi:MAG: hypothetical protein BJ554DRAFT_3356 [Olpidium bornovanus]|uniref:Uncharacterized protein n=1 Tax=Olpidium bornovanus TaxID=278681 RepID=A0A8H7ZP84_9FUNG|nr:MAG: hypothetical protein BJ554DRAFT_3356 [Olpidium bornovanus]
MRIGTRAPSPFLPLPRRPPPPHLRLPHFPAVGCSLHQRLPRRAVGTSGGACFVRPERRAVVATASSGRVPALCSRWSSHARSAGQSDLSPARSSEVALARCDTNSWPTLSRLRSPAVVQPARVRRRLPRASGPQLLINGGSPGKLFAQHVDAHEGSGFLSGVVWNPIPGELVSAKAGCHVKWCCLILTACLAAPVRVQEQSGEGDCFPSQAFLDSGFPPQWVHPALGLPNGRIAGTL